MVAHPFEGEQMTDVLDEDLGLFLDILKEELSLTAEVYVIDDATSEEAYYGKKVEYIPDRHSFSAHYQLDSPLNTIVRVLNKIADDKGLWGVERNRFFGMMRTRIGYINTDPEGDEIFKDGKFTERTASEGLRYKFVINTRQVR